MSTLEDLIVVQPSPELQFRGPFTPARQAFGTLQNKNNYAAAVLRQAELRPDTTYGKLAVTVTLQLQGLDFDPVFEQGKHKFMVQHCIAPTTYAGEGVDDCIRTVPADQIHSSRLYCTFVDDDKLALDIVSPQRLNGNDDEGSKAASASTGITNNQVRQGVPQETSAQQLKAENERLRAQLAELTKKNAQLRQSELRLRNVASKSNVVQPVSVQPQDVVVQPNIMTSPLAYAIGLTALILGFLISRLVF